MPAFHDRRTPRYQSVDEVRDLIPAGEKDTFSKHLIDGRYLVRGVRDPEDGNKVREFVLHEVLPNGRTVERGRSDRRYKAAGLAGQIDPTSVYDI
jgi:hypothetical protein